MRPALDPRLRRIGWLLTPLLVWAASFVGAWVGAIVAERTGRAGSGPGLMIGGALGMVVGVVAVWAFVLRRRSPPPPDPGP